MNPKLQGWFIAGVVLLVGGLVLHALGGRPFDLTWLVLSIGAAVVWVVGFYRYHEPRA